MKVLRTLILVTVIAVIGACGLLQEKNEGALASTYSSLYAFFETAAAGSIGCYPDVNNNNYVAANTLRAMYSFQIERPSTLVVCVKNTTSYDNNNNSYNDQVAALSAHTISFFTSNTKIDPGKYDIVDLIRIPQAGTLSSVLVLGAGLVCPFNSDTSTTLVGRYNMETLTDYSYIVAVDDMCGTTVGTGQSPFWLAKQYGVTY